MRFSRFYGLNQSQAELDFVDIDPDEDIPLFFDPYVFANEDDAFCEACDQSINSFFQRVLDCVVRKDHVKGRALLSHLNEPNEICFGWSEGKPRGRGIGKMQASQIYDQLAASEAAKTGLLTDLAECELFVEGIGPDKISDITANIIRNILIKYTNEQCELHGIKDLPKVPSGSLWNVEKLKWEVGYVNLPVIEQTPTILVPKKVVRWMGDLSHQHQKYYRHFVLNFLRDQYLNSGSALVNILSDGRRRVYKSDVAELHPLSKDFLFRFSRDNPKVFEEYREAYKRTHSVEISELDEDFDDDILVDKIATQLTRLKSGGKDASRFHKLMVGVLEYLFYPNLTYPKVEHSIHDNRKRLDIQFANAAKTGFFRRIASHYNIPCPYIAVECKNYSNDPENPELDQLAGRFSPNRGKVGILCARMFENRDLFLRRCKDTSNDQRGFIIPLADDDILALLKYAADGKRSLIDDYLEDIFRKIVS